MERVRVYKRHVLSGERQEPLMCPVALALIEKYDVPPEVTVKGYPEYVEISRLRRSFRVQYPEELTLWIDQFDAYDIQSDEDWLEYRKKLKPINFSFDGDKFKKAVETLRPKRRRQCSSATGATTAE